MRFPREGANDPASAQRMLWGYPTRMSTKVHTFCTSATPWCRALALVLSLAAGPAAGSGTSTRAIAAAPLGYAPVQTANPLKGFMPYASRHGGNALPHSMEFFYLPLSDLMDGPESFTWHKLEAKLDPIAGRGHHAVFRVYLDYPKKEPGIPVFLRHGPDTISGTADDLVMRSYHDHGNNGVSLSPDYTNPHLRSALLRFIAAFGERYDGDPRIGFIQLGLLGFWGEWHTFPHSNWFPPPAIQEEILGAYDKAFDRTRLLVRVPQAHAYRDSAIGYHDDSFAYSTLAPPAWHFSGRLAAFGETERWRTQPIGGEIRPENQPRMWEDPSSVPEGQDYERCVAEIHPSWMLAHGAFVRQLSPAARNRAARQSRMLGYEFHVPGAVIEATTTDQAVKVSATLRNAGVAPFYYHWPLEMAVLDAGHRLVHKTRPDWCLTGLLPGDPDRLWRQHTIPAGTLGRGSHKLLVRAVNPLPGGLPLRFANTTQDADLPGWLTLGSFQLEAPGGPGDAAKSAAREGTLNEGPRE